MNTYKFMNNFVQIFLSHSLGDAKGKMIGIVVGVGLFIVAMVFSLWFWRKKKNRRKMKRKITDVTNYDDAIKIKGNEHLSLKLVDLDRATNHFSSENMIGQGGFGCVYKVNLLK